MEAESWTAASLSVNLSQSVLSQKYQRQQYLQHEESRLLKSAGVHPGHVLKHVETKVEKP